MNPDTNAFITNGTTHWESLLDPNHDPTTHPVSSTPSIPPSQSPAHYAAQQPVFPPSSSTTRSYTPHAQAPATSPPPTSSTTPYYNYGNGTGMGNALGSGAYYQPYVMLPHGNSLPISSYSTLSGATNIPTPPSSAASTNPSVFNVQQQARPPSAQSTTPSYGQQASRSSQSATPTPQLQSHQQAVQQQQPAVIDPALISATAGNPYLNLYPYAMTNMPPGTTNMSQVYAGPATSYQYMQPPQVVSPAQLMRNPTNGFTSRVNSGQTLGANPALNQPTPSYVPTSLAPVAPAGPTISRSTPSSSTAVASSPSPQPLSPKYRDILTSRTIDKAPETTANSLISLLSQSTWSKIDAATRLDILTKIRDNAGKDFYSVWATSSGGMDVLRDWLKDVVNSEDYDNTLMPLLSIIDRLPLTVGMLASSKIGKVLIKVTKDPPSAAAKDLAAQIETKWRALARGAEGDKSQEDEDGAKSRKRKPETSASAASKVPIKKQIMAAPAKTSAAPKKIPLPATKDSKADISLFTSKPKPKLPSFRKITPGQSGAVKKEEPDSSVAQPSSIDPFQEAMKLMGKNTPPPVVKEEAPNPGPSMVLEESLGKNGKPKKKVTFPTDDRLVLIKYIERAIYDDDNHGEGTHHSSYRDLDIDEGHALHAMMFEELIDYYEPALLGLPEDVKERVPRGTESTEAVTQEEREKAALMAVYMSPAHIPDTPSELHAGMDVVPDEANMVHMLPGVEVASLEAPTTLALTPSLTDLLAKISGKPAGAFGLDLQQPHSLESQHQLNWGTGDNVQTYSGENSSWNGQGLPPPTGVQYSSDEKWETSPPTQPRWAGKGRQQQGGKSNLPPGIKINAPCKFFHGQAGCRNGDSCPFIHGRRN